MKKAKTEGLEWLAHSLMAFNGSGYADMNNARDFLDSYIAYNSMRKRPQAVRFAQLYEPEVLSIIADLLERTYGAGRLPTEKNLKKFQSFRANQKLL